MVIMILLVIINGFFTETQLLKHKQWRFYNAVPRCTLLEYFLRLAREL